MAKDELGFDFRWDDWVSKVLAAVIALPLLLCALMLLSINWFVKLVSKFE